MPRQLRSATLQTRTSRAKLTPRPKPYWFSIAPGISLGYRRNAGVGSWSVRAANGDGTNWVDRIALADDAESSNGKTIMDFSQACDRAKLLARGKEADAGRPATVREALADYAADLAVRDGGASNATQPLKHLPPALLATPVALLRVRELRAWRNGLAAKMPASTVNRMSKSVKACLNLAASHDERITNRSAWTVGLAQLPEADDTESNLVLSDEQVRDIISAAYAISDAFGLYVETHAATGARSGQIAMLDVGDLKTGSAPLVGTIVPTNGPLLRMPSSLKGKNRRTRTRKPMPISAGLAMKLKQAVCRDNCPTKQRDASDPLLSIDGQRWTANKHRRLFEQAARDAKLPAGATIYALRHSLITKLLLKGVPVRLVASSLDTSIAMIEKTYSKFIADHGDDQMRRALLDDGTVNADNVVALKR